MGFRPFQPIKHDTLNGMNPHLSFNNPSSNLSYDMEAPEAALSTNSKGEKKSRKRRRLSCERDLSPESFRKARNKRLAKESRNRKGKYVKTLENKISELETKIVELNEKLESYRKRVAHLEIQDSRGHESLSSAQDYWHNDVSAALKEKSKTAGAHMKSIINYFVSTLGVEGSDRK